MEYFNLLKKNTVFKFVSSVKLAVPLMIILALIVAAGTVFESRYNAEYAKLVVYGSTWFSALMILLWINIFCSTISRIPYKLHHLGFVITHIGLMTLLAGGVMTTTWGIDGQLRVAENASAGTVVLPGYVVGYQYDDSPSAQTVPLSRLLNESDFDPDSKINANLKHLFYVKKYLPFSRVDRSYASSGAIEDGVGLSFIMKNQNFNMSEWLHSKDNPEIQLGPATLRLIIDSATATPTKKPVAPVKKIAKLKSKANASSLLTIKDRANGKVLGQIDLRKLPQSFQGVRISLTQKYSYAVVAQNKLVEGNPAESKLNPALALSLEKEGKTQREVVYAKFPDFSMNKEGSFGLSFSYETSEVGADETETATNSTADFSQIASGPTRAGNLVEFHVIPGKDSVLVRLVKDGQTVGQQELQAGQTYETPWMGIRIILGTVIQGSRAVQEARAVGLTQKMDLPPSSLQIQLNSEETPFWLSEGDSRAVQLNGRPAVVFFARQTIDLPFKLFLNKFSKIDYPGTETPMSYQSLVKVENTSETQLISMNEPLKRDGFTVYQASYVLQPGQTPESIFSVNRDPGRPVKYFGSLILCLGIIIFTLMRSRWWLNRQTSGGNK